MRDDLDEERPGRAGDLADEAPAATGPMGLPEVATQTMTQRQLAWRRFKRHKLAIVCAGILVVITLATILAGVISPFGFAQLNLDALTQSPNLPHLMGTDTLGRDEFTRVLYGGRISLLVGITVAVSAGVIGTVVGALAGYYGRWIDNLLMRMTDLFLAIPFLVTLVIASIALRGAVPTPWDIVIVLTLFFWMPEARIVRGLFLSLKEKEFVEAARSLGASNRRIIFRHILPNAMGPIIVGVTLAVAAAILTESALSFLGFGVQPPTPTWGNMLSEARNQITAAPWLLWFPGLMILVTSLCVNFLGDGLRDALDPHQRLEANV